MYGEMAALLRAYSLKDIEETLHENAVRQTVDIPVLLCVLGHDCKGSGIHKILSCLAVFI